MHILSMITLISTGLILSTIVTSGVIINFIQYKLAASYISPIFVKLQYIAYDVVKFLRIP